METRNMSKLVLAVMTVLCVAGTSAMASTIAVVESQPAATLVTVDSSPVITAILSQPGTVNGKAYASWSFMVNDGTGSLVTYGSTLPGSYTPVVGDAVNLAGTYSPYHQIPEVGTLTALNLVSSGNSVPGPVTRTIPQINVATEPLSTAGYMLAINNVTISGVPSGTTTFGIANIQATMTDSSSNSMVFYYWPTSYASCNANLFGQTIPTGPVNMTGFVSVYTSGTTSTAEFTPLAITAVPEPTALGVLAVSGLALGIRRRRQA